MTRTSLQVTSCLNCLNQCTLLLFRPINFSGFFHLHEVTFSSNLYFSNNISSKVNTIMSYLIILMHNSTKMILLSEVVELFTFLSCFKITNDTYKVYFVSSDICEIVS